MEEKNDPLVSVIIPVYNSERYIEKAVNSIIKQTYKNLEILITDDCSTDNSYNILLELSQKDKRINLFKNIENKKIVITLNDLVKRAKGEYIARMDSDDISMPERIESQVRYLQKHKNVDICGINIDFIDENDSFLRRAHFPRSNKEIQAIKFFRTPFCHPTVMLRSSLKDKMVYTESFLYAEDYGLWLDLLNHSKAVNLDSFLFKYRIHENQVTKRHNDVQIKSLTEIYKCHLGKLLTDVQINDLCTFVVLRKVTSKINFLKIIFIVLKNKKIIIPFRQAISLFINVCKCKTK